ncbi:MAG: PDZ domain-containing protein [Planctomycetales bacterium]|nr:PDZ domain-containing protein [Planctomycetales bacterium]
MHPMTPSPRLLAILSVLMLSVTSTAQDVAVETQVDESTVAEHTAIDNVTRRVLPALVRIEVLMEDGRDGRMVKQRGFGSGTIISREGYVLTNHHVAGRGTRFRCTLANRDEIPAELIGTDALSDLAVVKLDLSARRDPTAEVPVAEFGDSSQLKVGDAVFALGSPAALSQSVTLGIVANTEMIAPKGMGEGLVLDGENVGELVRWIGHDAIIYGGNSGGPLVNEEGLIIGVNEVGIGSLGGAIPGNLAKEVAQELIAYGKVERGWVGIEVQPLLRSTPEQKGVLVSSVFAGSPAEAAGVQPGDYLYQLNGQPIPDGRAPEDIPLFNAMVLSAKPGSRLTLDGQRDGKEQRWEMEVVPRMPTVGFEREYNSWGMTARPITVMTAVELKRPNISGVQVHSVRPGGPAADAKPPLKPDDVITRLNDTPINNIDDLEKFNASLPQSDNKPQSVLVAFERGVTSEQLLTVVRVGREPPAQDPLTAERGWLGADVQVLGRELAEALDLKGKTGVRITRIGTDTPAAAAGLQQGDILLKLDGKVLPVRRPEDVNLFRDTIGARSPGTEVSFDVVRQGSPMAIKVTLGARPQDEDDAEEWQDDYFEFTARDLTTAVKDAENLPMDLQAARVVTVVPNGWASLAGLRTGDLILSIDGEKITGAESLRTKLHDLQERQASRTVFAVQRGVRRLYLELEPS